MSNRTQIAVLEGIWDRLRPGRAARVRVPTSVTALDMDGSVLRVVRSGGRDAVDEVLSAPLELPADADRNDPAVMGAAIGAASTACFHRPRSTRSRASRTRVLQLSR